MCLAPGVVVPTFVEQLEDIVTAFRIADIVFFAFPESLSIGETAYKFKAWVLLR